MLHDTPVTRQSGTRRPATSPAHADTARRVRPGACAERGTELRLNTTYSSYIAVVHPQVVEQGFTRSFGRREVMACSALSAGIRIAASSTAGPRPGAAPGVYPAPRRCGAVPGRSRRGGRPSAAGHRRAGVCCQAGEPHQAGLHRQTDGRHQAGVHRRAHGHRRAREVAARSPARLPARPTRPAAARSPARSGFCPAGQRPAPPADASPHRGQAVPACAGSGPRPAAEPERQPWSARSASPWSTRSSRPPSSNESSNVCSLYSTLVRSNVRTKQFYRGGTTLLTPHRTDV